MIVDKSSGPSEHQPSLSNSKQDEDNLPYLDMKSRDSRPYSLNSQESLDNLELMPTKSESKVAINQLLGSMTQQVNQKLIQMKESLEHLLALLSSEQLSDQQKVEGAREMTTKMLGHDQNLPMIKTVQVMKLEAKVKNLNKKVSRLEAQLEENQERRQKQQELARKIQDERVDQTLKLELKLSESYQEMKEQIAQLNKIVASKEEQIQFLKGKLEAIVEETSRERQELAEQKLKVDRQFEELDQKYKIRLRELQAQGQQLQQVREEYAVIFESRNKLHLAGKEFEQEIIGVRKQLEEKQRIIGVRVEQLQNCLRQIEDLDEKNTILMAEQQQKTDKNRELVADIDRMNKELSLQRSLESDKTEQSMVKLAEMSHRNQKLQSRQKQLEQDLLLEAEKNRLLMIQVNDLLRDKAEVQRLSDSYLENSQMHKSRCSQLERSQKEIVDMFNGRISEIKQNNIAQVNKLKTEGEQKDQKYSQLRNELRDQQMNKKDLSTLNQYSLLVALKEFIDRLAMSDLNEFKVQISRVMSGQFQP